MASVHLVRVHVVVAAKLCVCVCVYEILISYVCMCVCVCDSDRCTCPTIIVSHDICVRARELQETEGGGVSLSALAELVAAVEAEPDAGTAAAAVQSCRCIVTLLNGLERASASGDAESSEGAGAGALIDAMRTVVGVGRIAQEDLADNGGASRLIAPLAAFAGVDRTLTDDNGRSDARDEARELELVGKACRAIVTWCKGFEAGKLLLMAQDAHVTMTACAERIHTSVTKASRPLCNLCDAIRALCTGDDVEVAASKTFTHARLMGEVGAHHALVAALRTYIGGGAAKDDGVNAVPSLCNAIKAVGANDEICQEIAADGAIELVASVLASAVGGLGGKATAMTRGIATSKAAFGLLRQLAKSDTNKALVLEQDGIVSSLHRCLGTGCGADDNDDDADIILEAEDCDARANLSNDSGNGTAAEAAEGTQQQKQQQQLAGVREQAIGMLVSLSLRNPGASTRFCDDGIVAAVLESMRFHHSHYGVQRQGCMMIRNVVVRCPELRAGVLELGAEKVIRAAKSRWPDQCGDVGSAALRDLGLENYND